MSAQNLKSTDWKYKYLDAVEQLEAKERARHQVEEFMRRSLGRMALISQGHDSALDRCLGALRKALVRGGDVVELNTLLDDISEKVKALGDVRSDEVGRMPPPDAILVRLLESLQLPKVLKGRAGDLRRRLESGADENELDGLVQEVSRLVLEGMNAADSGTPESGRDEAEGGLIGRLFKRGRRGKAAEEVADDPARDFEPPSAAGAAVEPPLRPTGPSTPRPRADAHADRSTPDNVSHRLHEDSTLPDSLPEAKGDHGGLRLGFHGNGPGLEEVFLSFLDCLSFPPEYLDRVRDLRERLLRGVAREDVQAMMHDVVDLVADVRGRLEREKSELEDFLQQLTVRLNELDSIVEGAESNRIAVLDSGRRLGEAVSARVSDIESVVNDATSLDQMKTRIQGSLENIREYLADHRRQEERRETDLESQLRSLTQRLGVMEDEAQQLRGRLARAREQAIRDPLTGAFNRQAYEQRMADEQSRWQRYGNPLTMMLWDVDHFKRINDTYGHKAGDRALQLIVRLLTRSLRGSDFLARIGGEEFAVLLPETNLEEAVHVAEKLRAAVEASGFHYRETAVDITISGGIAEFRQGDDAACVFERADEALYRAKRNGRNRCQAEGSGSG